MQQGGDGSTYELWYTDVVDGKRKSVPLDFDRLNNTFSFVMPSSEIVLIELHYNNNIDDEFEHRDGFCGLPDVLESIDNNTSTEENNNTNNQTVNLTNGLVAHYEFEGNANDSSGNDNNGTEYGGVFYVDGVIGQAGSFDGVDDYIEVINDLELDKIKNTFTISAYILDKDIDDGIDDDHVVIAKGNVGHIAYNTFVLKIDNDKKLFLWLGYGGDEYQEIKTDYIVPSNKFVFYSVVYDGQKIKVYANGKQVIAVDKKNNSSLTSNNGNIEIGRQSYDDSVGEYKSNWNGLIDDLRIYNRALNEAEIKELYKLGGGTTPITTSKTINLLKETHQDGTVIKKPFTKQWTFNKDLTDLNIEILENSYQNTITSSDLIKDGKTLKVNLTPNTNSAINKLVLQFKNSNGEIVKVSGSKTFWSLTKTNHKPRLADGQITRLVGVGSSYLDIETYDSDGDSVTLSVEESAGGSVSLNGNRLSASFSDGKVAHTIKIGLDDGKEKVVKTFTVIDFSQNSIENFYSDVDVNSSHFKAIAFATLKGVVGGQIDPNDETKRVFRPDDEVSLAEALKMVINAERKAGLIELTTADAYMEAYPKWAMKYYTFAREKGALDRERSNLATLYPTREMIAKLIVKTLDLDSKIKPFGELHFAFSDEDTFSDAQLRHYGEIAHIFGLFMLDDQARAKESVSRAELVDVIRKIFMIPKGELVVNPVSVEKGEENITATLSNVVAQNINSSYELYDSSADVSIALTSNTQRLSNPIDSTLLPIGENIIYGFMSNHGVRGVALATVNVNFVDSDNDGIPDRDDKWSSDTRYAYDDNGNGIPDILDIIYNLGDYTATDSVEINGEHVAIEEIVRDGGVAQSTGGTVQVIELNVSTNTIVMNNLEEYNLSLSIGDTQQQNLDVLFELNDASLATLTPSWNYEVIDWETYSENNLTLTIKAKAIGESNLTIRIKDEDNREVTKTIHLSVLEKNANTIIDIRQPNWTIYGDTTSATVTNVYDSEKEREVIKLTGNGKKTSFRIGNRAGRASYVGAWHNKTEKILKWSMKYDEPFRIYIPITTKHGNHYLTYTNQSIDTKGKIRGGKVSYGLGEDSTDGTWHTFTRDLEADWNAFMPNDPFVAVNGFFISGSGYIDNIILLDNLNPNLPKVLIANAGEDKIITFGESVTLDASGSSNGDIVSYSWVDSDGNNIGDEATLTLDSLSVGTHTFTVTVTDNDENRATDSVTIVVKDAICPEITKISSYDTTNTALDMILSKDGKKAYVVGETALTILDMSDKSNPKLLNSYNISAKSVTLSNDEKIAYILVDGALKILDINDSRHLEVLSSYNTSAKSVIVSDESKIAYLPNDAFLDINDSRHPKLLNSEIYNSSYNKTINGKKLYIFDEEFGAIKIFDISDASHPKYIDYIAFGNDDYYYDFPMDVTFSDDGKRAYLSAVQEPRYSSSSERANYKSIIGIDHNSYGTIFETLNNPLPVEKGLSNDGRTIYITDESTDDLKIFDTWGKLLGTYYTDVYILNVTLSKDDKVAYIVDENGLKILDVSNKSNPKFISSYSEVTDKIKKVTLSNDEKTAYILYENGNLVLLDISDFKNLSNFNPSCFDKSNRPNHPILLDSYSLGEAIVEYNTYEYFKQSIRDVILSSDRKKIYIIKDIIESSTDFEHDYSYLEVIDVSDSIHLKPLYDYYDRSNDSSCTDDDFCKDNISPIIDSVIENGGEREANSGTLSNGKNFYEIYIPDESDPYASSKDIRISIFGLPSY